MKSRFTVVLMACAATLLLPSVASAEVFPSTLTPCALSPAPPPPSGDEPHAEHSLAVALFSLTSFLASDDDTHKTATRRNDDERLN